ncbi:MAG: hypothetical protein ACK5UV_02420, partial [bacterium]
HAVRHLRPPCAAGRSYAQAPKAVEIAVRRAEQMVDKRRRSVLGFARGAGMTGAGDEFQTVRQGRHP